MERNGIIDRAADPRGLQVRHERIPFARADYILVVDVAVFQRVVGRNGGLDKFPEFPRRECLAIPGGIPSAPGVPFRKVRKLGVDHRRLDRIQPEISAHLAVEITLLHPVVPHQAKLFGEIRIAANRNSPVAGSSEIFCGKETEIRGIPKRSGFLHAILAAEFRADRLRRIFDHGEIEPFCNRKNLIHPAAGSKKMDRDDCAQPVAAWSQNRSVRSPRAARFEEFQKLFRIKVQRSLPDIHEDRFRPHAVDAARRCKKCVGSCQDGITRADAHRHQDGELGIRSRGHADRMSTADEVTERRLEILDCGTQNKLLRLEETRDTRRDLLLHQRMLAGQIKKRNAHSALFLHDAELGAAVKSPGGLAAAGIRRHLFPKAHGLNASGWNTGINQSLPGRQSAAFTEFAVVLLGSPIIGESGDNQIAGGGFHRGRNLLDFRLLGTCNLEAVVSEINRRELSARHARTEEVRPLDTVAKRRACHEVAVHAGILTGLVFVARGQGKNKRDHKCDETGKCAHPYQMQDIGGKINFFRLFASVNFRCDATRNVVRLACPKSLWDKDRMTDELNQAVESGRLDKKTADVLGLLTPGAYCQHKSWGFGRVAEWNLIAGQIFIDFAGKKAHPMQALYAAETLTPIPDGHILARKASDPEAVRALAKSDPLGLARQILGDLGGKATADQVAATLQPEIFDATGFKKWWETVKKKMKADGHFQIPSKKTDSFVLLEAPVNPGRGLIDQFRVARHTKDQVAALDQITKALGDLAHEVEELQSLAAQIEDTAAKGRKLQSAAAVEMLLARDEILARHDALKPGPDAPAVADILIGEETRLPALFAALPASKHRKVLESFEIAFGERWADKALRLAQQSGSRLVVEIARSFEKTGKSNVMKAALARWISERSISSETLIWLCKERGAGFNELFNAELLAAVFSALESDMLAERRTSRLRDLLMDDHPLLGELIAHADRDTVRDTMRKLILTPVFDDLTKRSLMARIVKLYPETQNLITGDAPEEKTESLTVSWASMEKRKADYEHLIYKEIPQNLRDINVAKEQGDLRENFGFKAAKEQQRVLERRKIEAERDLSAARGTDFENPDTTQVSIGTVITLVPESGETEIYSILGAWDSAPDLGIVSYKAAIGQILLGRKPGETVELPGDTGTRRLRIEKIVAFTEFDLLREKVHSLSPAEN